MWASKFDVRGRCTGDVSVHCARFRASVGLKLAVATAEKWYPVSNAVNFPVHVTAEAVVG